MIVVGDVEDGSRYDIELDKVFSFSGSILV